MKVKSRTLYVLGAFSYLVFRLYRKAVSHYLQVSYEKRGVGLKLNGFGSILGLDQLQVESNVHIGNGYHIDARGGVFIGENVHISRNLVIYSTSHEFNGIRVPYDNTLRKKAVVIEKNVWIGMNVIILPGAKIREGAIIGAGSVVSGEVEPKSIYTAPKSHFLKYRDIEKYDNNVAALRYSAENGNELRVRGSQGD